jgi:hypothetical protein
LAVRAYALRYDTPEPGQRLGGLPTGGYFDKRVTARSENTYNMTRRAFSSASA